MFKKRLKIGMLYIFKGPINILGTIIWIITGKEIFEIETKIIKLSKEYQDEQ